MLIKSFLVCDESSILVQPRVVIVYSSLFIIVHCSVQHCKFEYFITQRIQSFYSVQTSVLKDDGFLGGEALFITQQSSTNTDISAEIEGNRVLRLFISGSVFKILYLPLKAAFPFSF